MSPGAAAAAASPAVPADPVMPAPPAEIVAFRIGDCLAGMDIRLIREIKKRAAVTPVRRAPEHVGGIINLRGQIVTLVDLRGVLSPGSGASGPPPYVLVVSDGREIAGLLADTVEDTFPAAGDAILPPPANLRGGRGACFLGVYRSSDRLIPLLDPLPLLRPA